MIKKGILKGGKRTEPNWEKTKLGEPFKKTIDSFREKVLPRQDFDPTALLQFGLFMSRAVINMLKENEATFGVEVSQRAVNKALIKTGKEMGRMIIEGLEIPAGIKPIEIISYITTIVNTQSWTSIEEPMIDSEDTCSFNILWCPLQDVYRAFDCRVQRYLVQGIINAVKERFPVDLDYQIEFTKTIPAGGDCCRFVIKQKSPDEPDMWETYSKLLERLAMKRLKKRQREKRKIK